jgi:membrane protein DedA with SNARE-associated domain
LRGKADPVSGDLLLLIESVAGNPLLLALILFGATFIAEDFATVAAGIVVARLDASPVGALAGVILGTAFGDIALYAVGRWGRHTGLGKRLRGRPDVRRAEQWVAARALWLVFAARFMPGFRLPVFTASGLVRAPAWPVATIIAVTTPVWTAALFETARRAGSGGAEQLIGVALPAACLILLTMIVVRRRAALAT